jgi:hypothetical protein
MKNDGITKPFARAAWLVIREAIEEKGIHSIRRDGDS